MISTARDAVLVEHPSTPSANASDHAALVSAFTPTPIPPTATSRDMQVILHDENQRLQSALQTEWKSKQRAETHCALAALEIKQLRTKLYGKEEEKVRKTKRFSSGARFLMRADAVREREERRKEQASKEQAAAEKRSRARPAHPPPRRARLCIAVRMSLSLRPSPAPSSPPCSPPPARRTPLPGAPASETTR